MTQKTVQNIVDYLLKALTRHRNAHVETHGRLPVPPLFVGLQGPQGIGKTTLTRSLQTALDDLPLSPSSASSGNDLIRKPRLAILSLDDFYLPYEQLVALASKPVSVSPLPGSTSDEPHLSPNKLLEGRGQPGTHDIPLLEDTLVKLSHINTPLLVSPSPSPASPSDEPRFSSVQLPIFDKSLHSGMGDRVPPSEAGSASTLSGPVDIVVLEGWCMGFYPIPSESLRGRWDQVLDNKEDTRPEADLERRVISSLGVTLPELDEINGQIARYAERVYPFFATFIQLAPDSSSPYSPIYRWRLEQEHDMKARNGGRGMMDEEVAKFIDRYIPGYIFFSAGVQVGYNPTPSAPGDSERSTNPPWKGNGLRLVLDVNRELVKTEVF